MASRDNRAPPGGNGVVGGRDQRDDRGPVSSPYVSAAPSIRPAAGERRGLQTGKPIVRQSFS